MITCSRDLDDSPDIHTTCLACGVVVRFSSWFSQLVCLEHTVHVESGLAAISCLWKSFYKSGQDLSVNLSDYVFYAESLVRGSLSTRVDRICQ